MKRLKKTQGSSKMGGGKNDDGEECSTLDEDDYNIQETVTYDNPLDKKK